MRGPLFILLVLSATIFAAPVSIPFRISRGMILLEATIQGSERTMNLILDSGAGGSILAKRTAGELDLALTGRERVRTVSGTESAGRAVFTQIHLGTSPHTTRFSSCPLVIDLARESRSLGIRVDGLLGVDFFEGRSIRIDFKRSQLHLSPTGKPGPRAIRLPLHRSGDGMFVGMSAADLPLPRVRLDTGCSRSLCWSPPAGSSLPGFWRNGKTMKVDLNLGSLLISAVPTDVYRKPLFAGEDGLLGTGLLSRFESVWIDPVNRRIAFEELQGQRF